MFKIYVKKTPDNQKLPGVFYYSKTTVFVHFYRRLNKFGEISTLTYLLSKQDYFSLFPVPKLYD